MRAAIPLESSYASTRLDANRQQTLNLFPHTLRGYRQIPGYVEFANFQATGEAITDSNESALTDSNSEAITASITPGGATEIWYSYWFVLDKMSSGQTLAIISDFDSRVPITSRERAVIEDKVRRRGVIVRAFMP